MPNIVEKAVEQSADKVAYAASGGAFLAGMTASDIAAFAGIVIAMLTFFVNWYYKHKADKRAEARELWHRRGDIPEELEKANERE